MPAFRHRGMNDQRDRGRRKKHHKTVHLGRGHSRNQDSWTRFETWLAGEFRNEDESHVAPSHSFSLKRFLQSCDQVDLASDEKLRQLAIHWENQCVWMDQPKGWEILKRIYDLAIRYDSDWPPNYHSLSISARACAEMLERETEGWALILKDAEYACLRGLEVDPDATLLHLSLGRIHYERNAPRLALESLQESIKADPKQMWAVLYRAHCLHDLEAWEEAAEAYRQVDRSFFERARSWRAVLLRDQLASCLYHAGQREES